MKVKHKLHKTANLQRVDVPDKCVVNFKEPVVALQHWLHGLCQSFPRWLSIFFGVYAYFTHPVCASLYPPRLKVPNMSPN